MHTRYLVTVDAVTPADACAQVEKYLVAQGFVIDPKGRFSGGVCDWFVIGGRWSGLFGWGRNAALVTPSIYERWLLDYEGFKQIEGFIDLEHDPLSRGIICRKFVVVVDAHR